MSQLRGDGNGKGYRMSAAEQAFRNSAIMAQLHAGEKVRDVAEQHDLTTRQVQRIAKAFSLRPTALGETPMAVVERALREIEERKRNLALLAAETLHGSQPAVALGALKELGVVHERHLELLSEVGKLPDQLEVFRSQSDVERLGHKLVDLVGELSAGLITMADVQAAVRATLKVLQAPPVVDGIEAESSWVPEEEDEPPSTE